MKILLINKFHYIKGGDSSYMFSLAEVLKKQGHTVIFFSMNHPLNFPCEQQKYFVDYIDFVQANQNKNLINSARVLSRVIYYRQARLKIANLIKETKPDVAHLNNIHAQITPSIIYELKKHNIPIVWTLHDYQWICPNTNLVSHEVICEACKGKKYYQCIVKKCKKNSISASFVASIEAAAHALIGVADLVSCYISPSQFLINKFLEFGWDPKKMLHLPYCLSADKFVDRVTDEGSYALYIGRLESYKGVKTLLRAVQFVPNVHLKIVGEGTEKSLLMKMANELNLKNVEFTGHLNGEALQKTMLNCRYVIVPSEWYENYPYAVMEAMAAGKPVIASRIGGLPEMINDGTMGFLFEPQNYYDLGKKINILESDESLQKQMGEEARRVAQIKFDQDFHYKNIMNLYSRVL